MKNKGTIISRVDRLYPYLTLTHRPKISAYLAFNSVYNIFNLAVVLKMAIILHCPVV
jgi:hypothetical protein